MTNFFFVRWCYCDMRSLVSQVFVHPEKQTQLSHGIFQKKAADCQQGWWN